MPSLRQIRSNLAGATPIETASREEIVTSEAFQSAQKGMPSEEFFTFGPTALSLARLRGTGGRFVKMDAAGLEAAIAATYELTEALAAAIETTFAPHTRSGYTMSTLKTSVHGLRGEITIGGGASFIEEGTDYIDLMYPDNAEVLRFEGADGDVVFTPFVNHPNVEKDPFIERAQESIDFRLQANRIATFMNPTLIVRPTGP